MRRWCPPLLFFAFAACAAASAFAQAPATQVYSGGHHGCVVTPAGGVSCWGLNFSGQLGDGTNNDSSVPVPVTGLASGVVAITGGGDHTCALTTAGGVKCWGSNLYGQLAVLGGNRNTPADVPGLASGIVALEGGEFHTCALSAAGGVQCWGNNFFGQLGDGTNTTSFVPVPVVGLASGVKAIASGDSHVCALLVAGGAKCWGDNQRGQLGNGTLALNGTNNGISTPVDVSVVTDPIASITTGRFHTCVATSAGAAQCWGRNDSGQLGNGGAPTDSLVAVGVSGLSSGVAQIDAGFTHTCAVLSNGAAQCWGRNDHGQLGNGTTGAAAVAAPVPVLGMASGVMAISAAFQHTCALTSAGSVRCFGLNTDGRLGNGAALPAPDMPTATPVVGFTASVAASDVAAGGLHSCMVDASGGARCWGRNFEGQLGDGGNVDSELPVRVSGLASGVAAIATGGSHSCALTTGGGVKCWGSNASSQLGVVGGNGNTPVDVPGLASGVAAIAAGELHTCALTTGGGVKCWGDNGRGQLGDGGNTTRAAPMDVTGLASGVASIAAGSLHSCATLGTGGAKCWGWNLHGQLGNGTTALNDVNQGINTPVDVVGVGSPVARIVAGESFSCALVAGAAKCWGRGDSGQLGDGLGSDSLAPVGVSGFGSGVADLGAGLAHACAINASGAASCWGANAQGQLGAGTVSAGSNTPLAVLGFASAGAARIRAGHEHTCVVTTDGWARCWGENASGQVGDGSVTDRSSQAEVRVRGQELAFAPPATIQVGAPVVLAAAAQSALAASFDVWSSSTCAVAGSTLTASNVGLCGVRASQGGDADFHAAPSQPRILVVAKGDQSITFGALAAKTMLDAPFSVSATSSSGLTVAFSSLTPTKCGVTGTTVSIVADGTCTLAADQAGDGNYNAAPQVTQGFAITKADQAITFGALANKTLIDVPFAVSATASSGLAVSFSSTTPAVCTVSGSTVTIVATGTCTIAADQAGNATYNAAPQVAQSFTVTKASQAITFGALADRTLVDTPFGVSATASSGLAVAFSSTTAGVCAVSGTTVTIVATGTCSIAADQPGDATYDVAPRVTRSFNVTKASQAITFAALAGKTYGDAPFALSATASSGLAVAFSSTTSTVCTVAGATVTLVGAGNCTIDANQPGDATYNAAPQVSRSFTVAKASQAITFAALADKTFGDAPFAVSATASSGLSVAFASGTTGVCTVAGTTVSIVAAGTCTITATQTGDANYNPASPVARSFTVAKANQAITFGALAGKTYGDAPFTVSATASSGLTVAFSSTTTATCTVAGTTVTILAGGTCTIAADQAGTGNYNPAPRVTQSFTVAKASQSITFAPLAGKTFGDAPFALTASASSGLAVAYTSNTPAVCTVAGANVTIVSAGACTIAANQAGNGNYLPAAEVAQGFTVAKAAQTITFGALAGKTMLDPPFVVSATASSGFAVAFSSLTPANCSVAAATVTVLAAGTCTIAANQAGDANYNPAPQVTQGFAISKVDQAIAFGALANKTLIDLPFTVSATANSGLAVSFSSTTAAVCTVSGNTVTIVALGTCTIAANQAGNGIYNAAPQVAQSFNVAKASQTITFAVLANRTLLDTPFGVSAIASSALAVVFSSPTPGVCTVSGTTVTILATGLCTLAADQPGNGTYEPAPQVVRSFNVTRASQAITFGALAGRTYGDAPFPVAATASSGLPVAFSSTTPLVCTVSATTVTIVGAGTCTINANQPGNATYDPAPQVPQSFAVAKAAQAIAFGALPNKTYGDAPFAVSATASSGLAVAFSSATPAVCTVAGTTVTIVSGGTCTIAANQGGNPNYNPAPQVTQGFTVARASQSITFPAIADATMGEPPFGIAATASSGLTVAFSSLTPAVCGVSGATVTLAASGTCTIAANQAGNASFNAAPQVSRSFTVDPAPETLPRLGNIATRGQVLTGNDVMIGGFVIGGSGSKTVVIRARGPSLIPFGITNALANPTLRLVRSADQGTLAINDDWGSAPNAAAIASSGFAPSSSLESAILATLPPGAYTAIVSGVGDTTGVGIVEVFEVDHPEVPLANIATRGQVLTGNDVMIGGFVIQGSGPQTVVVRARGPSLYAFGITNALANPRLQLVRSSDQSPIAFNDDWGTASNAADLVASGFAPSSAEESAILITLQPGAYTAIVSGANNGTGVGIVEVFAR